MRVLHDCVKNVQIRSFFWSVFSRIQSECGEIPTRKNSVFGHFSSSSCNTGNKKDAILQAIKKYSMDTSIVNFVKNPKEFSFENT